MAMSAARPTSTSAAAALVAVVWPTPLRGNAFFTVQAMTLFVPRFRRCKFR
jgi:hypothetical protein